jgi:hypothetical protein
MENSKSLLQAIEAEEQKNKKEAARIQQKKDKFYQGLSIELIKHVFKVCGELKKPFRTFKSVNNRMAELESLYPGYLGFLQKADSWETGFDSAQVKYLVDYLLTSKWNKDGDFWRVMAQIADTVNVPANPFRDLEEKTDG